MKKPTQPQGKSNQGAFSLIEVVVALGVATFAGFALIGLLSVGLKNTSDSKMQLQAATLMEEMCSVRRAAPVTDISTLQTNFPLPVLSATVSNLTASTNLWLTWDGTVTASAADARFGFLYNITAPTGYSTNTPTSGSFATAYLCLYWPAQVSPTKANLGHFEVSTTFALP